MILLSSLLVSTERVTAKIKLADGSQTNQILENTTVGCQCELLSGGQVHP